MRQMIYKKSITRRWKNTIVIISVILAFYADIMGMVYDAFTVGTTGGKLVSLFSTIYLLLFIYANRGDLL